MNYELLFKLEREENLKLQNEIEELKIQLKIAEIKLKNSEKAKEISKSDIQNKIEIQNFKLNIYC